MTLEDEINRRLADKKLRLATREENAKLPTTGTAAYTMLPAVIPALVLPVSQHPSFETIEIPTKFYRIKVELNNGSTNWYWVTKNFAKYTNIDGKEYYSYGDY